MTKMFIVLTQLLETKRDQQTSKTTEREKKKKQEGKRQKRQWDSIQRQVLQKTKRSKENQYRRPQC